MPKIKSFEGNIPAFYRKTALDLGIFYHINAVTKERGCTKYVAARDFLKYYNIPECELSVKTCMVIYNRVYNNFLWKELKKK